MIRSHPMMPVAALMALSALAGAHAVRFSGEYDPGPIMLPAGVGFSGTGPTHRRGRFKRNQRRQRKGQK